jgi:RNA polymerase sigma factor (sigma-70 family)
MELRSILSNCKTKSLKDQKILYEYTYTELFHVCLRYTQNQHDAEEVFNIGMLKIFQYIITDKNEIQNYLGFSSRIFRLTAIDHYKESLSPVLYNSNLVYENDTYYFVDQAFEKLDVEDIFAIIQGLPHKERIVFSMFEIDGFSHREIALELKINENHSKWLLHNAKKLLKVKLIQKGIKSCTL